MEMEKEKLFEEAMKFVLEFSKMSYDDLEDDDQVIEMWTWADRLLEAKDEISK